MLWTNSWKTTLVQVIGKLTKLEHVHVFIFVQFKVTVVKWYLPWYVGFHAELNNNNNSNNNNNNNNNYNAQIP